MAQLSGHVVAITGGARGIGRATAAAFIASGAAVAIGDLDVDLAREQAAELATTTGGRVVALGLDVTDPGSFRAFLDAAEAELGAIDVLVNNAGIMPSGRFLDEDPATTDRILDINVRGVLIGSRLAGRRFVDRGHGHLINLASLAGVSAYPGLATYCASKHAVVGFTEVLARELHGSGVAVTAVLPGIVRTELSAGTNTRRWVEALSTVDPEEVAAAIVAVVTRPRPVVTVPKRLAVTIRTVAMLPYRARLAVERVTGATTAFTQADATARERYHQRLRSQVERDSSVRGVQGGLIGPRPVDQPQV